MKKPLTISELIFDRERKYTIPLYQRNFAWTDKEISQLIIDILDSVLHGKEKYYIGTLVACKNKSGDFAVIDGQQRYTAILLILATIQNSGKLLDKDKLIKNPLNLSFQARGRSNAALKALMDNHAVIESGELYRGYRIIQTTLAEYISKPGSDYERIDYKQFYDYVLNKVLIFVNEMPENTDVNLYFERFNSRGEQLEAHEIIKSGLMDKLFAETGNWEIVRKFAKIWDSCAEFETPCIKFFEKQTKSNDTPKERERIFRCHDTGYELVDNARWSPTYRYGYDLKDVYADIKINDENKRSLLSVLESDEVIKDNNDGGNNSRFIDESNKYRCIVNFNTFLYYVLYITDDVELKDIQLDDKKLEESFKIKQRDSEWILKFGENLLKCKFIFDNLIIRNAQETTSKVKEGQWFLHKAYRVDKNDRERAHRYVQTKFDKNSFSTNNDNIIMLQAMFAVTFAAFKDTKWLFETMQFLFEKASVINDNAFADEFHTFLEIMSKRYANERIASKNIIDKTCLRYNEGVSIYAFNLMDYVLWRNQDKLKTKYPMVDFNGFVFTYRRSIEHWYPQNPNGQEGHCKMSEQLLHSFGNLCNIVASQNSTWGNQYPSGKLGNWRNIINTQSLKLQMMAKRTDDWGAWDETKESEITQMENELIDLMNEYLSDKIS